MVPTRIMCSSSHPKNNAPVGTFLSLIWNWNSNRRFLPRKYSHQQHYATVKALVFQDSRTAVGDDPCVGGGVHDAHGLQGRVLSDVILRVGRRERVVIVRAVYTAVNNVVDISILEPRQRLASVVDRHQVVVKIILRQPH
jgi:hypothetical protein